MRKENEFFGNFRKVIFSEINTLMLGEVVSYNDSKNSVTVDLLNQSKNDLGIDVDYPLLINMPCNILNRGGFLIKAPYTKGDKVIIGFCQKDITEVLAFGKKAPQKGDTTLDLNDSVCLGDFNPFNEDLATGDNLVIKSKTGSSIITVEADRVIIESDEVLIGSSATEAIPLGGQLKTWLDGHKHSPTGLVPTTASPAPSTKAKVE